MEESPKSTKLNEIKQTQKDSTVWFCYMQCLEKAKFVEAIADQCGGQRWEWGLICKWQKENFEWQKCSKIRLW